MDKLEEPIDQARNAPDPGQTPYQDVLDHLPDAVMVINRHWQVRYANPAAGRLLAAGATTQNFWDVADFPLGQVATSLHHAMTAQTRFEREIEHPSGRWLELRAEPCVEGMTLLLIDITLRKQAQQQLQSLASELTHAEQRERRRLARVLHDHVQQLLVAAKLRTGACLGRTANPDLEASLQQVESLLDQAIHASRSLAVELSPPVLHDGGLIPALQWLARRQQEEHGLVVQLELDPQAEPRSMATRLFLFRAAHELLFNVVKHAQVLQATIRLQREQEHIVLTVEDHGRGFEKVQVRHDDRLGLFNIAQRAELLGGQFDLSSQPGQGARVCLKVPLQSSVAEPPPGLD